MTAVRLVIAALAIVSCPVPASAQDHLEPERGILPAWDFTPEYPKKLRAILLKGASRYYGARMFSLPSFRPEWVVTVAREDGDEPLDSDTPDDQLTYCVEYVGAEERIYPAKADPEKIGAKRSRTQLDRPTAEAVQKVWRRMLCAVHYGEFRSGADGIEYHFSRSVPFADNRGLIDSRVGFEEGRIWSPGEGTLTFELVAIGEALKAYALSTPENRIKLAAEIRAKVDRLNAQLDRGRRGKGRDAGPFRRRSRSPNRRGR